MSLIYAIEKLSVAETKLAISEGDIKNRLLSIRLVFLGQIPDSQFPEDIRNRWITLKNSLTSKGVVKLDDTIIADPVVNTLRRMHRKTASMHALEFITILQMLRGYRDEQKDTSK